ncbi:MAG: N-formylglutamate amidohydrolase [Flavobacteriaceae bacterium]|nr:N-formylglutamate amidohydrolase [Flavobacteriaceae bacterium]
MKKLILHIPHSSELIPIKEGFCVTEEVLNQEILKLTDWYTDDLFENEIDFSVIAPFSRIFCDTERFADDSREIMAQFGMGVLYEKTDDGQVMRKISSDLRTRLLKEYYWKHHKNLTEVVSQQLEQFHAAIIVDCHSFPQIPINRALDKSGFRPDFNIGTDAFHTPKKLIDAAASFFNDKGYTLGIDKPYSGSIVPMPYYQKEKKVQSIMLEINRNLYLNEPSNEKSIRYQEIKQVVQEFLKTMRKIE